MKILLCFVFLLATSSLLRADEFRFQLNRFGGINIETNPDKASVRVYQGNKFAEKTLLASRLLRVDSNTFVTPKGTRFTLKHLAQPVVNDENRHLDSGDWQLNVSGAGKEFSRLKATMPFVAFGRLHPLVYLGKKTQGE